MAALRSLMVASSVAFALACQEVGSSIDQATRLPDVMSDSRTLAGACSRTMPHHPSPYPTAKMMPDGGGRIW